MESAEPRVSDELGYFSGLLDSWMNNDYEFDSYSVDEVEEQYKAVEGRDEEFPRYLKDAMMHVTSVAMDAALEGELEDEAFEGVLESARGHVDSYYFEGELAEPLFPNINGETRQFSLQGTSRRQYIMDVLAEASENGLAEWYEDEAGQTPDRVIGVSGGGVEPGLIASVGLEVPFDVVRCSPRKRSDESVLVLEDHDFSGENILVLDDVRDEGRAEEAVTDYVESMGAENVVFDAGIPEWRFL